jgi:hypothetical protein
MCMTNVLSSARSFLHAATVTLSGLFIASAVVFGIMALAFAGLIIGLAGALVARLRPQHRPVVVTLNSRRIGRGWIIDPSNR